MMRSEKVQHQMPIQVLPPAAPAVGVLSGSILVHQGMTVPGAAIVVASLVTWTLVHQKRPDPTA